MSKVELILKCLVITVAIFISMYIGKLTYKAYGDFSKIETNDCEELNPKYFETFEIVSGFYQGKFGIALKKENNGVHLDVRLDEHTRERMTIACGELKRSKK